MIAALIMKFLCDRQYVIVVPASAKRWHSSTVHAEFSGCRRHQQDSGAGFRARMVTISATIWNY
jgi:hypothetical protein